MSDSVYLLTGYKAEDFLYLKIYWKNVIHPEDLAYVHKEAQVLNTPGVELTQIYRIVHKDGSIKFIRDIKYSHVEKNVLKISGIIIDVTPFQVAFRENLKLIKELTKKNNELTKQIESINPSFLKSDQNAIANLSPREKEVFNLVSKDLSYKLIAFELNISINTVKTHLKNIRRKINKT